MWRSTSCWGILKKTPLRSVGFAVVFTMAPLLRPSGFMRILEPPNVPPNAPPRRPPQFGLRTLLGVMALFSGVFALFHAAGAVSTVALVWLLILVAAHVTANVWGTQQRRDAETAARDEPPQYASPAPPPQVPATRLRRKTRLGRMTLAATFAGVAAGCLLGFRGMHGLGVDRIGYAGLLLGTISSAVIGGFVAFLGGSFLRIAGGALHEAQQERAKPCAPVKPSGSLTSR